jgi:hypothetical protein
MSWPPQQETSRMGRRKYLGTKGLANPPCDSIIARAVSDLDSMESTSVKTRPLAGSQIVVGRSVLEEPSDEMLTSSLFADHGRGGHVHPVAH